MEPQDLLTLTIRMLDQLDLAHAVSDDGASVVIATEDDEAVFIGTASIPDATDSQWPVLCLDLPILTDVKDAPGIGPFDVAALNNELIIGKVAVYDGTLSIQHEFLGWPGAAEYRVAIETLIGQADLVRETLSRVKGGRPPRYSEVAD